MRKFSSYGPINQKIHYSVPRKALITQVLLQLKGDELEEGGHYMTIWAPRQTGKTSIMQEVFFKLKQEPQFEVVLLSLQFLAEVTDVNQVAQRIAKKLFKQLNLNKNIVINAFEDFEQLFELEVLTKPLILILDEFDALSEVAINRLVNVFRHIYNTRQTQLDKSTAEKDYLLHGLALIGVRTALGIENAKGSPFNIQRNIHIPNLTRDEVLDLFNQYQQESGQPIELEVVEQLWNEFQGQPGLTSWFGELLTETYNHFPNQPITMDHLEDVYAVALNLLPNNHLLNLISKAKLEPYKSFILNLFQTETKLKFTYDNPILNFLYLNGIVSIEQISLREHYVKFSCPYVQKRLFNYFAQKLSDDMVGLYEPFEDLTDIITQDNLNIPHLLQRYEQYLQTNRKYVLKNAPRRSDLRVYEAVFHFHLYLYLTRFLNRYHAQVQPEFPTGNGQIDLLIRHAGQLFGLELKSFADKQQYQDALTQAAKYGKQLGVLEIWLVFFIEAVDDKNRQTFEQDYLDNKTNVTVHPQFVQTGKENV